MERARVRGTRSQRRWRLRGRGGEAAGGVCIRRLAPKSAATPITRPILHPILHPITRPITRPITMPPLQCPHHTFHHTLTHSCLPPMRACRSCQLKYCKAVVLAQGTGALAALKVADLYDEELGYRLRAISCSQPTGSTELVAEVLGTHAQRCKVPVLFSCIEGINVASSNIHAIRKVCQLAAAAAEGRNKPCATPSSCCDLSYTLCLQRDHSLCLRPDVTRSPRRMCCRFACCCTQVLGCGVTKARAHGLVEAPRNFPAYGKARRFQAGRFFGEHGAEELMSFLGAHGGK